MIYATALVILEDSNIYLQRSAYFVKIGNIGYQVSLNINVVPKIVSGEYIWGSTSKSGKTGVSFVFTNSPPYIFDYKPVSGKTNISFSQKNFQGLPDSVFGSFCGILQNARGDTWTVKDGKFFFTLQHRLRRVFSLVFLCPTFVLKGHWIDRMDWDTASKSLFTDYDVIMLLGRMKENNWRYGRLTMNGDEDLARRSGDITGVSLGTTKNHPMFFIFLISSPATPPQPNRKNDE